jgi:hypothetical protein
VRPSDEILGTHRYRQLLDKLDGETALRADEFVTWQWLIGEHRGVRIPKAETALANFSPSRLKQMTGWRWPFSQSAPS